MIQALEDIAVITATGAGVALALWVVAVGVWATVMLASDEVRHWRFRFRIWRAERTRRKRLGLG